MKKKIVLLFLVAIILLAGCGGKNGYTLEPELIPETTDAANVESLKVSETGSETEEFRESTNSGEKNSLAQITEDQALAAIQSYCHETNPDLKDMEGSEDYTIYFDVSTNEDHQIVVLYRSYTGAQVRYYINPDTGETYVTEFVPGITDDEERTDETLNVRDYLEQ